jgi:hypothetical protein
MAHFFRRTRLLLPVLLSFAVWPLNTWASDWVASVDEKSGLPTLMYGGSPAMASSFVFFESNYGWTSFPTKFTTNAPYS